MHMGVNSKDYYIKYSWQVLLWLALPMQLWPGVFT